MKGKNQHLRKRKRRMELERAEGLKTEALEQALKEYISQSKDVDVEAFLGMKFYKQEFKLPDGTLELPIQKWDADIREFVALNCYTIGQILNRYRVTKHVVNHMVYEGKIQIRIRLGYRTALYSKKEIDYIFKNYRRTLPPRFKDMSFSI